MTTNRLAQSETPQRRKLTPLEIVAQGNEIIRANHRAHAIEWFLDHKGRPQIRWKSERPA
jgi:hypothetical protein